ncbi:MAG TPA: hypothetical protein VF279_00140 [Acidimicrobiales bacterium]
MAGVTASKRTSRATWAVWVARDRGVQARAGMSVSAVSRHDSSGASIS